MAYNPALSKQRRQVICQAFRAWYQAQPNKTDSMLRIGAHPKYSSHFKRGVRTPQPDILRILYEETSDDAFLFTREEKERILRTNQHVNNLPPPEEWPDRDEILARPYIEKEMHSLRRDIREITDRINRFGMMSEDDPKREQARTRLVGPAMELFKALQLLNLKYPSAFEDLLKQMSFATKLINPK